MRYALLFSLLLFSIVSCQDSGKKSETTIESASVIGTTEVYRAINLNGAALTVGSISFEAGNTAPNLTVEGLKFANQNVTLRPATDSTSAKMIRSSVYGNNGSLKISLTNVPNGTYRTSLYVWEDNLTATYSVALNGEVVQSNYVSGAKGTWKKLGPWQKEISGGLIELSALGAGDANFSGIVVEKVSSVVVTPPTDPATCSGTGSLSLERWINVSGVTIGDIPLATAPSEITAIKTFEISELGDNYATRITGFLCAPYTGNYTFSISGDDSAELFLSSSEDKSVKQKIAYYDGWTNFRDTSKYPEQKSATIALVAGKKYYVEVHHKEGAGGDSVSVGWMMPNGQLEFPIPSARLLPAPVVVPGSTTGGSTTGGTTNYAEPATYSAPIVITKGGTYSGNWKSMSMDIPAVEIKTNEPVTIINSHMAGPGNMIQGMWLAASLTVRNSFFHGKTPTVDNRARGRAIQYPMFKNLIVENNYFENTATVVSVDNYVGNGTAAETLKIRFNRVRNIDGRYRNGSGREFQNFVGVQNFMQNQGNPRFAEISWNEAINEPNQSSTEDLINFYQAGGRSDSIFQVHNNFLKGSYPNPANNPEATGSGIQIDGMDHNKTSYIEVHDNTIMQTLNGGMGMAAGSNVFMHDNRVISTGKFPDGSWMPGNFAGVWIFDYYGAGAIGKMVNNRIENNVIGWANPNYTFPYKLRLDYFSNLGGGIKNNTLLPDLPISQQNELDEYNKFLMKAQAAGIKIGP